MAFPQIVYSLASGPITLAFTYPPVQKPGARDLSGTRADAITLSGNKQSWWFCTEEINNLIMEYIDIVADMAAWDAFMRYAMMGGTFKYYPDASINSFTTYTLQDTDWTPRFNVKGLTKFTLKLRLDVP
jgi:hypothetical protein